MKIPSASKTVVVLGGTGFVGQHLCAALTQQGHRVRVLSRNPEKAKSLTVLPTLTLEKVDVNQQSELNAACKQADVVINLVGILNENNSHTGAGFRKVHVQLAQKVVSACVHNGVPRLLHMSALNADSTKGSSHYLRTKGEAESYVHRHATPQFHVTSFRPSVIFGEGDSFLNRFASLLSYAPGILLLPVPDSLYAPIYVRDVVDAMVKSIGEARTFSQRYDLCGPRVYTLKTLVDYVARIKQIRRIIVGLSPTASQILASFMEYLPGTPFSRDNYLSTLSPSVCKQPFPEILGAALTSIESVAPFYLVPDHKQHLLDAYRKQLITSSGSEWA